MWRHIFSNKNNFAIAVNALALRTEFARRRPKHSPTEERRQPTPASTTARAIQRQDNSISRNWLRLGLIVLAVGSLTDTVGQAQTRSLPSHGKIKIDSYNYLMRDVHPASQAQANYLQNRLFTSGLKKHERLERQERNDTYGERQLTELLQEYQNVARRLAAGQPVSARSLPTIWALVSVYGDRSEVYDALSCSAPHIAHDEFVPTSRFLEILEPNGTLKSPPPLLAGVESVDESQHRLAWTTLVKGMHSNGRLSAAEVARFHESIAEYRRQAKDAITDASPAVGRFPAKKYLDSLGSLADALYRPQQSGQIQQYVHQGGYAYHGGNMLGLIQHLLWNRVTPVQGSTAQVAVAEVARPICGVLEEEIAIRFERIDSLAAGEGHRPYASEYRPFDERGSATPGMKISQSTY